MELSLALLLLLLVLVVAFAAVRRAAKTRRKKLLAARERQRRRQPKSVPRSMSSRAEMRAYDDPSTLAGDITTHGSVPATDQSSGSVSMPRATGPGAGAAGAASGTTGTPARGPGKPRA